MILHIKGLAIDLKLGVTEQERSVAQRVCLDLQCKLPEGAGEHDELSTTLDYHDLSIQLRHYFETQEICLIEYLAIQFKAWWQAHHANIPVHFLIRKYHPNPLIEESQIEDAYAWHDA